MDNRKGKTTIIILYYNGRELTRPKRRTYRNPREREIIVEQWQKLLGHKFLDCEIREEESTERIKKYIKRTKQ